MRRNIPSHKVNVTPAPIVRKRKFLFVGPEKKNYSTFADLFNRKEKMNYFEKSENAAQRAREVLQASGIKTIWEAAGAEVRLVGSLRMGLIAKHRDIDLHVYSSGITEESSFAIASQMAKNPAIIELKCINGLHTVEHCIAWHVQYKMSNDEVWQIDIIHIEKGTHYDGYFEEMADRIIAKLTPEIKETILALKYNTPDDEIIHGVEYYESVIADGVKNLIELREWLKLRRSKPFYYWMPE